MLMAWKLFVLMKADVKIDCVLKLYCNVFLHLLLIPAKQTKSKDTAPATWKFCQEQINISSDTHMAYCPTMAAFFTKKHRRYFKLLCWQVEHFHPKLDQFKQMASIYWYYGYNISHSDTFPKLLWSHWWDKGKSFLVWKKNKIKECIILEWKASCSSVSCCLKWSAALFCLLFSTFVFRVVCPAGNTYPITEYF